jgi:uncharacterized membrane protein
LSKPAYQPPASSDRPGAGPNPRARRALRTARTEAVVVLAIDVALLAGLALGLLVAADALAVGVLLVALAGSSAASLSSGELLSHGAVVWLTNIITFGLLFWLLDEGGPRVRADRERRDVDFQFPQDTVPRGGWSPRLSDYLYVSLTNAIAVSPTDTMPLTRRAKGLMAVESLISYAVVLLVVARAVNALGSSA